jgi:uncharacterized membrane protein YecN with MAPEG domain
MPVITTLYAGLLGLILIALAFAAGSLRGRLNVSIGDGGHPALLLAMRRQANFVEYVPMALILIALLEMHGVSKTAIHGFGASLVVFRALHAFGLQGHTMRGAGRLVGAMGTAVLLLVLSIWAVASYF